MILIVRRNSYQAGNKTQLVTYFRVVSQDDYRVTGITRMTGIPRVTMVTGITGMNRLTGMTRMTGMIWMTKDD